MAGSTVEQLQALNAQAVLKFHVGGILFADYDAECPDPSSLIAADGTLTLPPGYTSAGRLTTDGITRSRSLTVTDTMSWQSLAVVRSDVTADAISLKVKFQEYNLVTFALREGITLADAASSFSASGVSNKRDTSGLQPPRRMIALARDTKYNVTLAQICPNVILSAQADEVVGRATELQLDATLNANADDAYGTDFATAVNGPGLAALLGTLLTVTPATATLSLSGTNTQQLTVESGATNVTASATYTSSNASIATVSSSGLVTGVAAGSATITATYNGATATSAVTVTA